MEMLHALAQAVDLAFGPNDSRHSGDAVLNQLFLKCGLSEFGTGKKHIASPPRSSMRFVNSESKSKFNPLHSMRLAGQPFQTLLVD